MATQWHYAILPPENGCEPLCQVFDAAYYADLMPAGMTLWLGPSSDNNIEVYFSPTACLFVADLLREWNAHACPEPISVELTPVAGDLNALPPSDKAPPPHYPALRLAEDLAILSFTVSFVVPLKLVAESFKLTTTRRKS